MAACEMQIWGQRLVTLRNRFPVGWELYLKFPDGNGRLHTPQENGVGRDLDLLTRVTCQALQAWGSRKWGITTMNIHPRMLSEASRIQALGEAARNADVILEVTEEVDIGRSLLARRGARRLIAQGVAVALDDVGPESHDLRRLPALLRGLGVAMLKLDVPRIGDLDTVLCLMRLAVDMNRQVVLEQPSQAQVDSLMRRLNGQGRGLILGQGHLWHTPKSLGINVPVEL